jgi:hypothetical protein
MNILPNSTKSSGEGAPKYTTYNGTCGNSGTPGTARAHKLLPLSVSRSSYGIQGAQYRQTTGPIRKV